MSNGWDNNTLKKLKALTGKGLSTAEIGKRLGISKNAVVGKLNRLGWNSKAGGLPIGSEVSKPAKKTEVKKVSAKPIAKAVVKPVAKKVVEKQIAKPIAKPVAKKAETKKVEVKKVVETKVVAKPIVEKKSSAKDSKKDLAIHQRIIQHSLEMANLKSDHCRWPIGDPDSENFHFCGAKVFAGKPYCYEHCKQAYQFVPQKNKK